MPDPALAPPRGRTTGPRGTRRDAWVRRPSMRRGQGGPGRWIPMGARTHVQRAQLRFSLRTEGREETAQGRCGHSSRDLPARGGEHRSCLPMESRPAPPVERRRCAVTRTDDKPRPRRGEAVRAARSPGCLVPRASGRPRAGPARFRWAVDKNGRERPPQANATCRPLGRAPQDARNTRLLSAGTGIAHLSRRVSFGRARFEAGVPGLARCQ
jgi:hypothetical protein